VEIVLNAPSGVTVNAYLLVPMKPNDGKRKFNVGPVNSADARRIRHPDGDTPVWAERRQDAYVPHPALAVW
jgi:hypothetical protein